MSLSAVYFGDYHISIPFLLMFKVRNLSTPEGGWDLCGRGKVDRIGYIYT